MLTIPRRTLPCEATRLEVGAGGGQARPSVSYLAPTGTLVRGGFVRARRGTVHCRALPSRVRVTYQGPTGAPKVPHRLVLASPSPLCKAPTATPAPPSTSQSGGGPPGCAGASPVQGRVPVTCPGFRRTRTGPSHPGPQHSGRIPQGPGHAPPHPGPLAYLLGPGSRSVTRVRHRLDIKHETGDSRGMHAQLVGSSTLMYPWAPSKTRWPMRYACPMAATSKVSMSTGSM